MLAYTWIAIRVLGDVQLTNSRLKYAHVTSYIMLESNSIVSSYSY